MIFEQTFILRTWILYRSSVYNVPHFLFWYLPFSPRNVMNKNSTRMDWSLPSRFCQIPSLQNMEVSALFHSCVLLLFLIILFILFISQLVLLLFLMILFILFPTSLVLVCCNSFISLGKASEYDEFDVFVSQVKRTLKFISANNIIDVCHTFISQRNPMYYLKKDKGFLCLCVFILCVFICKNSYCQNHATPLPSRQNILMKRI